MAEGLTPLQEEAREQYSRVDWTERLGFDPALYRVDVPSGTVDGEHIGIATALFCAYMRHNTFPEPERAALWFHGTAPGTSSPELVEGARE